ncbi:MAG: hypothetical protein ACPG08_02635, partial [Flavobacteriales bacterium]
TDTSACNYTANPTEACATTDACGVCGGSGVDVDADGICDDVDSCTDTSACNYNANPTEACATTDACGVCGGSGVDVDADGVCDDVDNCTNTSACNYDGSVNNLACVLPTTWYADTDSDGLGDASDSQQACSAPAGYVADSSDLCDDLTASNYADNPTAPCTYAASTYTRLDSTFACENQPVYSMDLDTMHSGTGAWSYTLVEDIVGFGSATINSNLVAFDLSAAGIGRDTIAISGTDGAETASIQIIVQESATYPYVTGVLSDGSSHANAEDGGALFSFAGHGARPVTVHYFEDAVMIFDGGTSKYAGYGDLQSVQSDVNGNWALHASQAIWIAGYTNAYGCYSPEPATSGTPTASPKLRHLPIPHLID